MPTPWQISDCWSGFLSALFGSDAPEAAIVPDRARFDLEAPAGTIYPGIPLAPFAIDAVRRRIYLEPKDEGAFQSVRGAAILDETGRIAQLLKMERPDVARELALARSGVVDGRLLESVFAGDPKRYALMAFAEIAMRAATPPSILSVVDFTIAVEARAAAAAMRRAGADARDVMAVLGIAERRGYAAGRGAERGAEREPGRS